MRHFFQAEQWLPYPVELVFSFFANPENLPRLMPAWQKARIKKASIVAPVPRTLSGSLHLNSTVAFAGAGTRMTITFRPIPLSPLRVSWDAEITEFVWNDHFCDVQLRGPFAYWHHCHRLSPELRDGTAGTLLKDEVTYELPFGFVGELAQKMVVRRQFRAIFRYRHEQTARLLAGEEG